MTKKSISLPNDVVEKINDYLIKKNMKFSPALADLVRLGSDTYKYNNTSVDILKKLDELDLQIRYLKKMLEQFYSDMEVDGGTDPKKCEALKLFWSKRIKDPFND